MVERAERGGGGRGVCWHSCTVRSALDRAPWPPSISPFHPPSLSLASLTPPNAPPPPSAVCPPLLLLTPNSTSTPLPSASRSPCLPSPWCSCRNSTTPTTPNLPPRRHFHPSLPSLAPPPSLSRSPWRQQVPALVTQMRPVAAGAPAKGRWEGRGEAAGTVRLSRRETKGAGEGHRCRTDTRIRKPDFLSAFEF